MDTKQFREAAHAAAEEIAAYYDGLPSRRVVSAVQPGYLRPLLPDTAPEQGEPWANIQSDIESKIMPGLTHWQHPNFMAFFPCAGSFPALIAEMYSAAFNGAHFNWICSPAVTELETVMLDWLARAMALPDCYLSTGPTHGGGVIHGTASEAIVTVMVAARDRYLRETTAHITEEEEREEAIAQKRGKLVALGSVMAHSSTKKAAQILGVRCVAVPASRETNYAMTGEALEKTITALKAKGLEPFYLTATYGTTDTCAVDDLTGIAETLARLTPEGQPGQVWVHLDGAYAGSALLCPEYQSSELQETLAKFHSVNFNAHKWLLTNFDCSCLWVRDRAWLVDALSIKPAYLRNPHSEAGLVTDYRDWQIPLGRRFRSLKLWFVMRSYGLEGLRAHLRGGISRGEKLAGMMVERKDLFEIITGPAYGLVVFRCKGRGEAATEEEKNALTKDVYEAINDKGEIYLTSSVLDGLYAIRVCTSTSPTMKDEHVQRAFEIIVSETEAALNR